MVCCWTLVLEHPSQRKVHEHTYVQKHARLGNTCLQSLQDSHHSLPGFIEESVPGTPEIRGEVDGVLAPTPAPRARGGGGGRGRVFAARAHRHGHGHTAAGRRAEAKAEREGALHMQQVSRGAPGTQVGHTGSQTGPHAGPGAVALFNLLPEVFIY